MVIMPEDDGWIDESSLESFPKNFLLTILRVVMSNSELATGYAALILADEGLDITADKLLTLTKSAGVEVEAIWAQLFAKALEGKDVKDMLLNVGGTPSNFQHSFYFGGIEVLISRWRSSFCCCCWYRWCCRCGWCCRPC